MLLIGIILGLEGQCEFLHGSDFFRAESEVKSVVCLWHNCVVHRGSFKAESLICDRVKPSGSGDLALILKDNLHVVFLIEASAAELKNWSSISLKLLRF